MTKIEYKRYFFSWRTFTAPIFTFLIATISFISSLDEKTMFKGYIGSSSHNQEKLLKLINEYDMFEFLNNFWGGDFSFLFITVIAVWLGVSLSGNLSIQKQSGQGTLFLARMSFDKYIKKHIVSQTLYIITVFSISMLTINTAAAILGGINSSVSFQKVFFILILQPTIALTYILLINGLSLLINMYITNKYITMIVPLFVFVILPYIVCSTIGNLSFLFARITEVFVSTYILSGLYSFDLYSELTAFDIFSRYIALLIFVAALCILYIINVKKFSKDYL